VQNASSDRRRVHLLLGANAFLTRRGRNSVAEETSSSEGAEKPYKAFSFAFFAASREENLLSKFVANCGYIRIGQRNCAPMDVE
jgi:hypothetical protein